MPFRNPILGGTQLVRDAINSEGYTPGSAGWSINRNGSAEFNGVVIRAGQVVSGTALYYNGTPALGTLVASISATAGVDAYGNAYPAGIAGITPSSNWVRLDPSTPALEFKNVLGPTSTIRQDASSFGGLMRVQNATGLYVQSGQLLAGTRVQLGQDVAGGPKDAAGSCAGIGAAYTAGVQTTTLAAYSNVTMPATLTLAKLFTATRIKIDLHTTHYWQTAIGTVMFAVLINGVDYDVAQYGTNLVGDRLQVSGTAYVASGLAAGSYSVQLAWKRVSGTGTVTIDNNDWLSLSAMEVSA